MSTIGYVNVSMEAFGGLLSLLFLLCLYITRRQRGRPERCYVRMLICSTALLFCDATAWLFKGRPDTTSYFAVRISNFLVFVLGYVMLALFIHYLFCFLSAKNVAVSKKPLYAIYTLMLIAVALTVLSQFNGIYYMIDEHNIYHRQGLFWLSQVFGIIALILNGGLLVRYRKHLKKREIIAFASYICLPAAALLVQIFFYGIAVLYLATTICLICIYISIQMEMTREADQRELELEKSRSALILSQIQPHFLYNSLLGIKQLCDTEPKKASEALEHFSYYLRGNLYSLSDPMLIRFEKEVEHVEDYLYLEKMRFGDRINVVWKITFSDFHVPSLTLQPIVENAVRHGLTKKDGGGTLTIKSEEISDAILITVSDDGTGFDTTAEPDNARPHVGIANVKKRVEVQCDGSLQICSEIGIGTEVKIMLPKEGFYESNRG